MYSFTLLSKIINIVLVTFYVLIILVRANVGQLPNVSQIIAFSPIGRNKVWQLPRSSKVIAFSPNGEMLATASGEPKTYYITPNHSINGASSAIEIRTVSDGKILQVIDFGAATSIAFSPDNNLIAAGNYGTEIKIWRISDGQLVNSIKTAEFSPGPTTLLAFSKDGQKIIASAGKYSRISDEPNQLGVWKINNGNNFYTLSQPYTCVAVNSDSEQFAFGGPKTPLTFYQFNDGSSVREIDSKPGICFNMRLSTDSKLIAFESVLDSTRVYNAEDGQLISTISIREPYQRHYPTDMALSPNNQYLAVSYQVSHVSDFMFSYPKAFFGMIRIWDIETGRLVATLRGHRKGTHTIAFSPDGRWLASAGLDNTIRFWRMPPRNYTWLWLLGVGSLAVLIYWQRAKLIG